MTRSELIEAVRGMYPHLTAKEADTAVRTIFERMSRQLAEGGRIELRGFGSFSIRERGPRQGRNPRNGAPVKVQGKPVIYFRAGKPLVQRLNGEESDA